MNTNQLPGFSTYNLDGNACRAVTDPSGTMWIAAADIAAALGVSQSGSDFARDLPDGALSKRTIPDALGRTQDAMCLSVEGMMLACLRTRGPAGEAARQALVAVVSRTAAPQDPSVAALARRVEALEAAAAPGLAARAAIFRQKTDHAGTQMALLPDPVTRQERLAERILDALRRSSAPLGASTLAGRLGSTPLVVTARLREMESRGVTRLLTGTGRSGKTHVLGWVAVGSPADLATAQ